MLCRHLVAAARLAVLAVLIAAGSLAQAGDTVTIVYLGVEDDARYAPQPTYTGLSLMDRQRPIPALELALRETRVLSRALGVDFALDQVLVDEPEEAALAVEAALAAGATAILLDLPAQGMTAALAQPNDGLLINIRDRARGWRDDACESGLLHTMSSDDMRADALAQHLRAQGWSRVLLLFGSGSGDAAQVDAARRALAKFGLTLAGERRFELSNDPRQRDLNNIRLLTAGLRYDVIWLVDGDGEFGRYVPYASSDPRPVVGSEGLRAEEWHWTFERYGAPQLNQRFRRQAGRDMTSGDWAGWVAFRAVVEAVQRTGSATPSDIAAFVRSDALSLDLYKGVPGSFRSWSGQLRQPILLATHNAVIARPPLDGFEHAADTLDTLGIDAPESRCNR